MDMHWDAIIEGSWILQDFKYAEFLWMQTMHDVLNMSEYGWMMPYVWQGSEYGWSTFRRVLNKPLVLNMLGLKIWLGYECARVKKCAEYAWINLNMP